MIHPLYALLYAALVTIFSLAIFWPKHGLLSRWSHLMRQSKRSYLEDALKHIYECERGRISCTLNSIAGVLFIKKSRIVPLIHQLENSGLVLQTNNQFTLTDKGREYALRMIRVHRIWESYLASETGTPEKDWHNQANIQEHDLNPEEIEAISARLGHPQFDPHGEPIPTREGDIPEDRGLLLTELSADQVAKIVQFEDDPSYIYQEIRENGICLGMQVDSVERVNGSIRFNADGFKKELSLIAAAQIRVIALEKDETLQTPFENLTHLENGETGKVIQISREIHGQSRRRLLDLGIVPGSLITKEMESAAGNPIAYLIKGACIALRREQARLIHIERLEE